MGLKNAKRFYEDDIMMLFEKKSYPYKVKLLDEALKDALQNGGTYIGCIAKALDFEFIDSPETDNFYWIKKK